MPIRLLIADDHALMREGLKSMLGEIGGISIVGEAQNGAEAVRLAMELSPHVVLMDITMPVLDGIEATRRIVASAPGTKVVALTMHTDEALIGEVMRAGATAAVQKGGDIKEVVKAIRAAAKQKAAPGPAAPRTKGACKDMPAHLTARQWYQGDRVGAQDQPQDRRDPPGAHHVKDRHPHHRRADQVRIRLRIGPGVAAHPKSLPYINRLPLVPLSPRERAGVRGQRAVVLPSGIS